jgi:hypothetical protein
MAILFECAQGSVQGSRFNLRICQSVFIKILGQFISIRTAFIPQHQKQNRLNKPEEIARGARASVPIAMPWAETYSHTEILRISVFSARMRGLDVSFSNLHLGVYYN